MDATHGAQVDSLGELARKLDGQGHLCRQRFGSIWCHLVNKNRKKIAPAWESSERIRSARDIGKAQRSCATRKTGRGQVCCWHTASRVSPPWSFHFRLYAVARHSRFVKAPCDANIAPELAPEHSPAAGFVGPVTSAEIVSERCCTCLSTADPRSRYRSILELTVHPSVLTRYLQANGTEAGRCSQHHHKAATHVPAEEAWGSG